MLHAASFDRASERQARFDDLKRAVKAARLDPDLVATDALCNAWYEARRRDEHLKDIAMTPLAVLMSDSFALDPDYLIEHIQALHKIVLDSDRAVMVFLCTWYGREPSHVKADQLGISRAAIYIRWKATLQYLRGRLHGAGIRI